MISRFKNFVRPSSRMVVYTCLFGQYETLNEQPIARDSGWDFICFTDNQSLKSDTWEIRRVQTQGIDASRESRRPKLQPHIFLAEYDRSLYIDNTVLLTKRPEDIIKEFELNDVQFCCLKHPWRDCTYDEAEEVIAGQIDDEWRVREQMDRYSREMPRHAGLIAGTFLLRQHNKPEIIAHGEDWYAHVLRYSKRDQLSFRFTALRHRLSYKVLELDLMKNDLFQWPVHKDRLPYGFDPDLYLWLNHDVARAGVDPARHYLEHGRQENRQLRYHREIALERLANKYRSDKGRLYYNKHFYSRVYEKYLGPLRAEDMTILEIGLLRHDIQARNPDGPFNDAPSLFMWRDYFANAEIHGFDINDFTAVEQDRIKFTKGDQANIADLARAVERSTMPLKVVIDDGLHASPHQQISFAYLFQKLEPGGLYIIEDLHYQPAQFEPEGSLKTLSLLKAIGSTEKIEGAFISDAEIKYLANHIDTINFYDSMDYNAVDLGADAIAVIRKRT